MKKKILVHALLVVVALALTATSVFAELNVTETSTRTNGATTISWDFRFTDLDYTLGDTVTLTATWNVDEGAAEYVGFDLGSISFTPMSKKDPAVGEIVTLAVKNDDNSITIEFLFSELHLCPVRNSEVGNAHFVLYLDIDMDGDGVVDTVMGYGVNVRVEEPR